MCHLCLCSLLTYISFQRHTEISLLSVYYQFMGGKEGSGSGRERRKEGGWGGVCWVLYDCLEAMLILIFTPFFY